MNVVVIVSAILAATVEASVYFGSPTLLSAGRSSQYRSQDNTGGYQFGYDEAHPSGATFRKETGDAYGNKYGSYGLRDADGRMRIVNYVADENGFRADIDTNEPGVAPEDPASATINRRMLTAPPLVVEQETIQEPVLVAQEPVMVAQETLKEPVLVAQGVSKGHPLVVAQGVSKGYPLAVAQGVRKGYPLAVSQGISKGHPLVVSHGLRRRHPIEQVVIPQGISKGQPLEPLVVAQGISKGFAVAPTVRKSFVAVQQGISKGQPIERVGIGKGFAAVPAVSKSFVAAQEAFGKRFVAAQGSSKGFAFASAVSKGFVGAPSFVSGTVHPFNYPTIAHAPYGGYYPRYGYYPVSNYGQYYAHPY